MSCANCFETVFEGARFCPLCGSAAVAQAMQNEAAAGDCPRCKKKLAPIAVEGTLLFECERCAGVWTDVDTFETVCAEREKQAAIFSKLGEVKAPDQDVPVKYVPCPVCGDLMNRSNFARISGVVIDTCKQHGLWFDASELPRIIEFINKGGLDAARKKEKLQLEEDKARLREERFRSSVDRFRSDGSSGLSGSGTSRSIRELIKLILD